jgi:hypothetical protein
MPRTYLGHVLTIALVAPVAGVAHARDDGTAKGVNPKDNITKFDVILKSDVLERDVRIRSLSFKYDRALGPNWGAQMEVPLIRFESPMLDDSGLGDLQVRARYVTTSGAVSYLAAGELVAPTASGDALGLGKWQLNPVIGAVFAVSRNAFVYAGYKHLWSFAGDDERPDVNASQPRVLAAYTAPQGWWVLGDLKYTRDHEVRLETLDSEAEVGTMLSPTTAISLRLGTSSLDSARLSTISLNGRIIF